LISPETGVQFLKDLCENSFIEKNQKILENYDLRVILNANPLSRERVEKGDFCLRENEHGVDLNRNYDAHF
jgi:murein tripeptide amidase MpaA